MSEYHDTNEDERDWRLDKLTRYAIGEDALAEYRNREPMSVEGSTRLYRLLDRVMVNQGDQWKLAGWRGLPFRAGGYEQAEISN